MTGVSYPLGVAIKGSGGRKTKENRHIRSKRSKRRVYKKKRDALIAVATKKWGSLENMPRKTQLKLANDIAHLRENYLR